MFHTPRYPSAICFQGNLKLSDSFAKEVDMLQTIANDATFGPGITFNTDVGFDIAISPDNKAFTAVFGGLEAVIDVNPAPPIVTRSFSFSVPLTGARPGQEIPFFVSGF